MGRGAPPAAADWTCRVCDWRQPEPPHLRGGCSYAAVSVHYSCMPATLLASMQRGAIQMPGRRPSRCEDGGSGATVKAGHRREKVRVFGVAPDSVDGGALPGAVDDAVHQAQASLPLAALSRGGRVHGGCSLPTAELRPAQATPAPAASADRNSPSRRHCWGRRESTVRGPAGRRQNWNAAKQMPSR